MHISIFVTVSIMCEYGGAVTESVVLGPLCHVPYLQREEEYLWSIMISSLPIFIPSWAQAISYLTRCMRKTHHSFQQITGDIEDICKQYR